MRIVIDLQGAQTVGSRYRGIGRYSLALTQAMVRQREMHEIHIALNGSFPETIEPLRFVLGKLMPQEHIHVWTAPRPVAERAPLNQWRTQSGQLLREAYIASLKPDIVHLFSPFEGFADDALTSVGELDLRMTTSATLHDLIPLIYGDMYRADPLYDKWYQKKIDGFRRVDLCLANSESSRREGIEWLNLPEERVVSVPGAADAMFKKLILPASHIEAVRNRYGLNRPFIMYTGGGDPRKNIAGLIGAYGRLPEIVRRQHQLAIVCSASSSEVDALKTVAKQYDLSLDDIVFTGFVSDADMVALYNLSSVFVFPSLHEGFGLPALEAMQCGVPVIGANTSSLPEVIGRADALFDPRDEVDIAAKLCQVLTDKGFREDLSRYGLQQAKKFNWDISARIALDAFGRLHAHSLSNSRKVIASIPERERPTLAFVSPLPPLRSGIATYSAELLPELARHYKIDVIVDQPRIEDSWIEANCHIRTVQWFEQNGGKYDRILYHFGNSEFHMHMFNLLDRYPGTVVLHDFYLSGVIWHMDWTGYRPGALEQTLWESHGYESIRTLGAIKNSGEVVWQYPANRQVLDQANGVIVHSQYSRRLAESFYGKYAAADWSCIPHLRKLPFTSGRAAARKALGLHEDDYLVCSFGIMGKAKLNHSLLDAWLDSSLAGDVRCRLVFVGANDGGAYGQKIVQTINSSGAASQICITGFAAADLYRTYLEAADAAVQVRALSRGETSGTIHDCMAYGLPTIVNANGSLTELPEDCVLTMPDEFSIDDLKKELELLRSNAPFRHQLGARARKHVAERHNPRVVADQYCDAIENFAAKGPHALRKRLVKSIRSLELPVGEKADWLAVARSIAQNHPSAMNRNRLFVDISELVRTDAKTGIQRVVRSVLSQLLASPPGSHRVEPIYASEGGYYRHACRFTAKLLGIESSALCDFPVHAGSGDVFLGLDLAPHLVPQCVEQLATWRDEGVKIYFVAHDLLPLRRPDWFAPGAHDIFRRWLEAVAKVGDGIVCVSRTVADDVLEWLEGGIPYERVRPLMVGWSHNGADILASMPSGGRSPEFDNVLSHLNQRQMVMMVGTLEPRKGHLQALEAFEMLWDKGKTDCLVIVGKLGWMMNNLVEKLRTHPELNHRLFWLEGATDETLLELYERADGVLMASEGEGFGLPLIEAAQHHKPILARDLAVFREIAGESVRYFSGDSAGVLATELEDWLDQLAKGSAKKTDSISALTWEQSTQRLLDITLNNQWYSRWIPSRSRRYSGTDHRLYTQVGDRQKHGIVSTGEAGALLYGPYISIAAGNYLVLVHGSCVLSEVNGVAVDVAAGIGTKILARTSFIHAPENFAPDTNYVLARLTVEVPSGCNNLEIRVWVDRLSKLKISSVELLSLESSIEAVDLFPSDQKRPARID